MSEQDRKTSTTTSYFPDGSAVVAACRVATANQASPGLLTETGRAATTAAGIRVRFTSSVHQELALSHLRALGYAVRPDSRPITEEHGEALLVTGWCEADLSSRAGYAERAVRELVSAGATLADDALKVYRGYVDDLGFSHEDARGATVQEFAGHAVHLARRIARRTGAATYASAPIGERDLRRADDATYDVLRRVAEAEAAHRMLANTYKDTVQGVIDLFVKYRERHGADREGAAAHAAREASEAAEACLELARADVERRAK